MQEIIRELEIVNDVNLMTLEQLISRYLSSEKSYTMFIKRYYDFYNKIFNYPLRALVNYTKLANLFTKGVKMYPLVCEREVKYLIEDLMYNKKTYGKSDAIDISIISFGDTIGSKITSYEAYLEKSNRMITSAINYNFFSNFNDEMMGLNGFDSIGFIYYVNYLLKLSPNDIDYDLLYIVEQIMKSKNENKKMYEIIKAERVEFSSVKKKLKRNLKEYNK